MKSITLALFLTFGIAASGVRAEEKVLTRFPALLQTDIANYDPERKLWSAIDKKDGKPVRELACLATVYLILERGYGRTDKLIDNLYIDPRGKAGQTSKGADPSQDMRIYEQREIDLSVVQSEIDRGVPVILRGTGDGEANQHFVLAIGYARTGERITHVITRDPLPSSKPTVRMAVADGVPVHPTRGYTFGKMRLVENVGPARPHTDNTAVVAKSNTLVLTNRAGDRLEFRCRRRRMHITYVPASESGSALRTVRRPSLGFQVTGVDEGLGFTGRTIRVDNPTKSFAAHAPPPREAPIFQEMHNGTVKVLIAALYTAPSPRRLKVQVTWSRNAKARSIASDYNAVGSAQQWAALAKACWGWSTVRLRAQMRRWNSAHIRHLSYKKR